MSIETVREARDAAWMKCRKEREPLEGSDDWTAGEVGTYRGFFNLGWQAALSTIDPEAIKRECAEKIKELSKHCSTRYMSSYEEGVLDGYNNAIEAILGAEPEKRDTP